MIQLDISEGVRHCDTCDRDTRHRITTVRTTDGDVSGTVTRCLEHDED